MQKYFLDWNKPREASNPVVFIDKGKLIFQADMRTVKSLDDIDVSMKPKSLTIKYTTANIGMTFGDTYRGFFVLPPEMQFSKIENIHLNNGVFEVICLVEEK